MTTYIDPLDEGILYSHFNTIAIGIQHERANTIGVRGLSKHNQVFDAFREPSRLLPILLDIPCFLRILDAPIYEMLEDQIIVQYDDPREESLPMLMVFGDCKMHQHPLIITVNEKTAIYCWNLYKKLRRQAKRLAKKESA